MVEECVAQPGTRAVCTREVQRSLKESAKRLIEDKIQEFGLGREFEVQHDQIRTPGAGIIVFQGLQDHTAESIKSLEGFRISWGEEAQTMTARSLELLMPTIRAPQSELWFGWNPRSPDDPVDKMFRGQGADADPNMICVQANYTDNPWFPDVLDVERRRDLRSNPHRYAHIWLGAYEPMAVGAIWSQQMFDDHRWQEAPDSLTRIVVAVDPAVSSEDGSNEHGIVVVGIDAARRGYVLDDLTRHGTPRQWAERAVAAADKWEADGIVVEVNQGGDMVKSTIQSVSRNVRIIEVRASKGKHVRAEPISALYATGQISHVGHWPQLEAQCCKMTAAGYEGRGSPDRVDALVWGLTELFPRMTVRRPVVRPTHARAHYNELEA